MVGLVIRLIELLIVVAPLVGVIIAGRKAWASRDRDAEDAAVPGAAPNATATGTQSSLWRAITRAVKEQDRIDTRWLDYELDVTKLLDYPVMSDMREPLTQRFHRAKLRADVLRPGKAEELLDDREAAHDYLDAVEDYVTAFNVAEAEAIRRRRNDFSRADQHRLARAVSLLRVATNSAATPQERETAYAHAGRELDGLVVLPERTRTEIERGIAGELGA
jgi:phage tail sheath gpL-like